MTSDSDRVIGIYRRHASAWASDRGNKPLEKDWLDRFLTQIGERGEILDIGCGSGDPIARYLISRECSLTGVDSSSELLAFCKEKFPAHLWLEADMRTLSLAKKFNGVLAWDSFFHLFPDDQRKMFPVFRDHSAIGGSLMFTTGPSHGETTAEYRGESLYHASLDPDEYRALLHAHGFEVMAHVVEDPSCGHHTVWLCRKR